MSGTGPKTKKGEFIHGGEAANPLLASLNRSQMQQQQQSTLQSNQPLYSSRHRAPTDHHHVSLKGMHGNDDHILQNVHMV